MYYRKEHQGLDQFPISSFKLICNISLGASFFIPPTCLLPKATLYRIKAWGGKHTASSQLPSYIEDSIEPQSSISQII